jgi:hypothetical protein
MILDSSNIVSVGGVEFGFETAEPNMFSVVVDFGCPEACGFIEMDSDEGRGCFFGCLGLVELVLGVGGGAEIVHSIVEGVSVFVVNEKAFSGVHNLAVHRDDFRFLAEVVKETNGIDTVTISPRGPVVAIEQVVDVGVNDCEK